jgi:hypothetical protein
MKAVKDVLMGLEQQVDMTQMEPVLAAALIELSGSIAASIAEEVSPRGFVMAAEIGIDKLRKEPVYASKDEAFFSSIRARVPDLAELAGSPDFAAAVRIYHATLLLDIAKRESERA